MQNYLVLFLSFMWGLISKVIVFCKFIGGFVFKVIALLRFNSKLFHLDLVIYF